MRRRHFRRLPRYRPYHGSLPSPFSVLRNKKKKKFSLSTLFSLLSANRRRAVARNPFCPKLFTSSTRSSEKNTAKVVEKIILNIFKEGTLWSRIYNFHYERERFLFIYFFFKERLGTVYEFSTGILSVEARIGYARTERRNRWRGGKIKKASLVLSP